MSKIAFTHSMLSWMTALGLATVRAPSPALVPSMLRAEVSVGAANLRVKEFRGLQTQRKP